RRPVSACGFRRLQSWSSCCLLESAQTFKTGAAGVPRLCPAGQFRPASKRNPAMNTETKSCPCNPCIGAACTCGCQTPAAAPSTCGCGCQQGEPCDCGSS